MIRCVIHCVHKVNVDQQHEIVSKNLPSRNHEPNAVREMVRFGNFVFAFNKIHSYIK
jgi:hypothetical protein